MSFISHAHATWITATEAGSAQPDAPIVPDHTRTPWWRRPAVLRLTVAWRERAEEHERSWEIAWRRPRPAAA